MLLNLNRRLALGAVLALVYSAAFAGFPDHPVQLVVPYKPGSPIDLAARLMAEGLSKRFRQPFIVENKPGASGAIAAEYVAKSKPDGHTLLVANTDILSLNPILIPGLHYDASKFEPVGLVGRVPGILCVRAGLGVKTLPELVAAAKKDPGKISFGSWGQASLGHLAGALLETTTGTSLLHVPYQGAAPAVQALISGEVDLMFVQVPSAVAYAKAGKINMLGAMGAKRSPDLPDLPTLSEQGLKGYEWETWIALVAPAGTPVPVLEQLNGDLRDVLTGSATSQKLREAGIETDYGPRALVSELIQKAREKWSKLIAERNITLT